ncbi:unnamed protein product [Urochloa humidicola]
MASPFAASGWIVTVLLFPAPAPAAPAPCGRACAGYSPLHGESACSFTRLCRPRPDLAGLTQGPSSGDVAVHGVSR